MIHPDPALYLPAPPTLREVRELAEEILGDCFPAESGLLKAELDKVENFITFRLTSSAPSATMPPMRAQGAQSTPVGVRWPANLYAAISAAAKAEGIPFGQEVLKLVGIGLKSRVRRKK